MGRRHKPHLRCPGCRLHLSVCICASLPRLETRTRLVLIVHQLEARKPTNTGLLAARCLSNAAVAYRGRAPSGGDDSSLDDLGALVAAGTQPVLLYPAPDATPLETWAAAATPLTLVVPDGTWSQAASTRRRLGAAPDGTALPCVTVAAPPAAPVVRRLRAPASPGRLATLEAIALALGVLEGRAVEEALLRVFRMMTERTLWTNGRVGPEAVTGGIPPGARPHDPLGRRTPGAP
jgi:DTW domain-containing protein YfiP